MRYEEKEQILNFILGKKHKLSLFEDNFLRTYDLIPNEVLKDYHLISVQNLYEIINKIDSSKNILKFDSIKYNNIELEHYSEEENRIIMNKELILDDKCLYNIECRYIPPNLFYYITKHEDFVDVDVV